jgi:hypothetical protein
VSLRIIPSVAVPENAPPEGIFNPLVELAAFKSVNSVIIFVVAILFPT